METNFWVLEDNEWILKSLDSKTKVSDTIKQVTHENLLEVEDLIKLTHLHEPSIINTLYERYQQGKIYTNIGPLLISINPYQKLNIYNLDSKKEGSHVYNTVQKALDDMNNNNRSQTLLASGESGSGKTVTTNYILHYLTDKKASDLEKKILATTPILEAFGNAHTIRNNNSSRYGKFIRVYFDNNNIKYATIDVYLLEKIRVIKQEENESNFHIFYLLLQSELKKKYDLGTCSDYNILSNGYINVKREHALDNIIECFHILDFTEKEISSILNVVQYILKLGNIRITKNNDVCCIDNIKLNELICHETMNASGDKIVKNLTEEECNTKLHTLIQIIYHNLFIWIVNKINSKLGEHVEDLNYIGLLDIFGFEIFNKNSLEQLHINYTNECLQQIFNKTIFKKEQEEYIKEEINWKLVEYIDNSDILGSIENTLFKVLDDQCLAPRGSDSGFISNIQKQATKHISFTKIGVVYNKFLFDHYAGSVEYGSDGFCYKNKIHMNHDITEFINNNISFISDKKETKTNIKDTLSSDFNKQLHKLVKIINETNSYFIRCIKPNDNDLPLQFNNKKVLPQVRYNGITESVRIIRAGFPIKFDQNYFLDKYRCILDKVHDVYDMIKNKNHIQIGKTKIYLKQEVYEILEDRKETKLYNSATKIQTAYKMYLYRLRYKKLLYSIIKLQSYYRCNKQRKIYIKTLRNKYATIIQKNYRMHICYKQYVNTLILAFKVQTYYKTTRLNKHYEVIQKHVYDYIKCMKADKVIKKFFNLCNTYKNIRIIVLFVKTYIRLRKYHTVDKSIKKIQKWYRTYNRLRKDKFNKLIQHNKKTQDELNIALTINNSLVHKMNKLLLENDRLKENMKKKSKWWDFLNLYNN